VNMSLQRIVIVGASLAGVSAAEKLRALGYDGKLVLIGGENALPYDRPPLSKQVLLGAWPPERTALRAKEQYADLAIDLRLGLWVTALDLRDRYALVDTGERVPFDGLIIATGVEARALPAARPLRGVHLLRTLADCIAIHAAFVCRPDVVVIGAGFIGAEVASTARSRGLKVTVVEPQPVPLFRAVGPKVGTHCARLHSDHGVDLRLGLSVSRLLGDSRVEAVELSDGSTIRADVVVVGIGAEPRTQWLETSGLELNNGVVCDEYCAAAPGVFAAGDVARWRDPVLKSTTRIEHWTNAIEQGRAAAENLILGLDARKPFCPVPYVWSDQYGSKLQFLGRISPNDEEFVLQCSERHDRLLALYGRAGRLSGVVTFNWPQMLAVTRQLIAEGASWEKAQSVATLAA
jgi:NADPH-dependent 2,4-dienoyl-CoA reductase/sulfur reductase-like enzyme